MRVAITGAAGFVGSHLVERFLREGYRVLGIDNFVTGSPENIKHISSEGFTFIEHDVTKPFKISGDLHGILHFASPASPVDFDRIPLEILDVNSVGTRNCLEAAREKNARFLMASTSEVYGDPLVPVQSEEYYGNVNTWGVRAVYDEAKRFSEALIYAYKHLHKLDVRIVRIFNTYGPRMRPDDGRVVPAFVSQALSGQPLSIFGDGKQTRSFCFVDDLVEGIFRLYKSDYTNPMNIGNPSEFTILEFTEVLEEIAGKKMPLNFHPRPQNDPLQRKPDITKAREILGWSPTVPLKEGLKTTFEWFKNKLQAE
ncbi:MAG: SDR family oxidoreductase [Firmicutes bacterium]|nr:SDR family oxidoreductase [Bacillota bacterium]